MNAPACPRCAHCDIAQPTRQRARGTRVDASKYAITAYRHGVVRGATDDPWVYTLHVDVYCAKYTVR